MILLKSLEISIIITLCALSIASNYALIGVTNVTLMDFLVFIGGFLFGPIIGMSIGISSWLIYGIINPIGFVPQIWLATMLSEAIYGLVGGLLGKTLSSADFRGRNLKLSVFFATVGFLPTVFYDLITNIVYAFSFDVPIAVAIFAGAPFTVLHEVANAAIFGLLAAPAISILKQVAWRPQNGFLRE